MMRLPVLFAFCLGIGVTTAVMANPQTAQEAKTMDTKDQGIFRVELLGASVGRQWQLEKFADRTGMNGVRINARQEYDFDKTKLLKDLLAENRRPDAVIIKECAAYFGVGKEKPGDEAKYRLMLDGWVGELRKAGVQPILATIAPVTERMPTWLYIKQLVKRYILRRDYVDNEKRLRDLWEYNDFVRTYALEKKIPLLDIERVVRVSDQNRTLKPEFASGDGLHLNQSAYKALDRALESVLKGIAS